MTMLAIFKGAALLVVGTLSMLVLYQWIALLLTLALARMLRKWVWLP